MDNTNIGDRVKMFLLSLLSRKFLLAIATSYIAFNAGYADGVLETGELVAALSPLLAFMGVEGFADVQQRKAEGAVKVEEKKAEVQEAKTETAKIELQTAKVEAKN